MHRLTFRLAAALLAASILVAGCGKKPAEKAAAAPLPVTAQQAVFADAPLWLTVIGRTEGGEQIAVKPQVSGVLTEVRYKEGAFVKEGDILYKIDPKPFAEALRQAKATRRQAEVELQSAERELRRTEKLYKAGSSSQKAYDDAVTLRDSQRAAVNSAKAAEAQAAVDLSWTDVRAPVSGWAGKTLVNRGTLVSSQSTELTDISQHADLRVTFAPSERTLAGADISTANRVEVLDEQGRRHSASLDYVAPMIEADTGTRIMRARLGEDSGLLPGDFVRVNLMIGVRKNAAVVPQKAVVQNADGSYTVFVAKDGKALGRTVTVDRWQGTDWLVTSGLEAGDMIITDQQLKLRDGLAVKVSAPAAKAAAK
ncbi:MAG: hypothetical protein ACFWTZ_02550 [Burkholderia sp.]|jgi:RND family efflux transporter MFP subunit